MKQPSIKTLSNLVEQFNTDYSIGDKVLIVKDSGSTETMTVKSKAYVLGGHSAMVFFEEMSGCYDITRVTGKL